MPQAEGSVDLYRHDPLGTSEGERGERTGASTALCCLHGSDIDLRLGSQWLVFTKGRRCSNDEQVTLSVS